MNPVRARTVPRVTMSDKDTSAHAPKDSEERTVMVRTTTLYHLTKATDTLHWYTRACVI